MKNLELEVASLDMLLEHQPRDTPQLNWQGVHVKLLPYVLVAR